MTDSIIDGTNIDTSIFTYSEPKPHASGGKVVNIFNKLVNSRQAITIKTPLMMTWGAQEGQDPTTKIANGKYTMSLQFPAEDYATAETTAFYESMRHLEEAVKQAAELNALKWFGKKCSRDVIDDKFNMMLRHPLVKGSMVERDTTKPPTLTVKIPQWSGVWKPEIYDEDGTPLYINGKVNTHSSPLEYLVSKAHVMCLIQSGGIWFVNGKFSVVWNLLQAVVQKPPQITTGVCLLKLKPNEKELMKSLPPPDEFIEGVGVSTIVNDSDDEYEAEEPKAVIKTEVKAAQVAAQVAQAEDVAQEAQAEAQVEVEAEEEEPVPKVVEPVKVKKVIRKKATA
jgi:hypothetical protein